MFTVTFLPLAAFAVSITLALIVFQGGPRSPGRWSFAGAMAGLGFESLFAALATLSPTVGSAAAWQSWRLAAAAVVPGFWLIFSQAYGRGDAVRGRRWLGYVTGIVVPFAIAAVFHADLVSAGSVPAAGGTERYPLSWPGTLVHVAFIGLAIVVLMKLEQTYRHSAGTLRWRIKFMLFGLGLLLLVRIFTASHALLFHGVDPALVATDSAVLLVAAVLISRSLGRRGHFETDVYLSPTALRHSLSALFVGCYLLTVGVVAQVLYRTHSELRLALTAFIIPVTLMTVGLVLQSDRLRTGLRRMLSRHFHRPVFDYETIWQTFASDVAPCREPADLARALSQFLARVFEAHTVTVWLLDPARDGLSCGGSTAASRDNVARLPLSPSEWQDFTNFWREHPDPTGLEDRDEPWAAAVQRWPAAQFRRGGGRICVPLVARGDLLGLVTLTDRIGGVPFGAAEIELLKALAGPAATAVLNTQLSQRLVEAARLQAFQTMAAFFVHDLKNAASTVDLMVQNLHQHFDNPAFRRDALRGLTKTMQHMNQLVSRLGLLRYELKVEPAPADLNAVVSQALAQCATGVPGPGIKRELHPLPPVPLDAVQFEKVIINLVRNAMEAAGPQGAVEVTTRVQAAAAICRVRDDGPGMTADFIRDALFKPFRTTKPGGLGIGLFQCKTIIEAHGGAITVTSETGHGTTVEVQLPVARIHDDFPVIETPDTHPACAIL